MSHSPHAADRPPDADTDTPNAPPEKLFTFASGGWVLLLAFFFVLVAAALVLYPVFINGFHPPIGDGIHADTYGFDLSNLTIPRDQLTASGNAKDQIDAIPPGLVETITPAEVALIRKNEHLNFLIPSDRVIGIVINGEPRAYPLRVLALHEMVNDVLGNTPIAVAFSPLCDSVVVWDRRIDGTDKPAVEFGVSGLLRSSNPVYYDRRSDSKQESLWPQLTLHAVSGPAVGKPLPLLPYTLTTWQDWTTAHPDTKVLLGLRRRKREYTGDPYNVYLHTDDLKFPVSPLWSNPNIPRKTPITVTSNDYGNTWTAQKTANITAATIPATTQPENPYHFHTFLFAWYAQHPTDTDYSAIKP